MTQSSLPRTVNVQNAMARMAEVPRVVETARRTIGRPPRVKVETAIRQTKGAIDFYRGSSSIGTNSHTKPTAALSGGPEKAETLILM